MKYQTTEHFNDEEFAKWSKAEGERQQLVFAEWAKRNEHREPVNTNCTECGQKLRIRTSKKVASVKEVRRVCQCGYQDVATVRPAYVVEIRAEELLAVRVCHTTTDPTQAQPDPIE